jgi:preprotein translocase subunit YajC
MYENLTLIIAQSDARPTDGGEAPQIAPAPPAEGTDGQPIITEPANGGDDGAAANGGQQPGFQPLTLLLPLILVFFFYFMWSSQRRERRKRQELMASLSKNDRVVTVGGVIGTVVELKDQEVVLKVDESSNTRMRFTRSAIQTKLTESES